MLSLHPRDFIPIICIHKDCLSLVKPNDNGISKIDMYVDSVINDKLKLPFNQVSRKTYFSNGLERWKASSRKWPNASYGHFLP